MTTKSRIFSWKTAALAAAVVALTTGAGCYVYKPRIASDIKEFDYKRDAQFVTDVFNKDIYWLWAGEGPYDFDYLLKNRASIFNKKPYRKEEIKVLYVGTTPIGFVTYSKTKFYQGQVRLLGVDQKFRGKGYGFKLLRYALDDLIKQGCTNIFLITRTTNPAQKLYKKTGFRETSVDEEGIIRFDYYV